MSINLILLILLRFFVNFHTLSTTIHVWSFLYSPKFHRLCVWSIHTVWYVNIPDMTANYKRLSDLVVFFCESSIIIDEHSCLKCSIFTKLSQIVYLTHFDISIYKLRLYVIESSLILCSYVVTPAFFKYCQG